MLAWDAGKSECHAVMVWIGVLNLPYCESRLTSYAGVSLQKNGQNYRNAGIAMELRWLLRVVEVKAEWALAGCKATITFNGVCKGSEYIRIFGIGRILTETILKCSSRVMGNYHARFLGGEKTTTYRVFVVIPYPTFEGRKTSSLTLLKATRIHPAGSASGKLR